ncbi:MAG: TetR/AcrR family transcriptional regulator [Thermoleophilaceae bacterium]|nr:TetR/AcrR family transcriptional regulator [Thermoleophilaceae bacterium]
MASRDQTQPAVTKAPPTRQRLIVATLELLEQGGYAAASVGAITERAGVAAGTLYRHFPSKAELFVEVFRSVCGREIAAMQKAAAGDLPPLERMTATITTFAVRALHNPRLAWALLAEPIDPLVDAERLAYRRTYRDLFAQQLRVVIDAGELPAQDADLSAALIVGAIGEALVGPLSPVAAQTISEDQMIAALVSFCRRAVGATAS